MCQRLMTLLAVSVAVAAVLGGMVTDPPTTPPTTPPTNTPADPPQVERVAPKRIEVTGAGYAYTVPESEIAQGMEILHGIAFGDGDTIAFAIDPMTVYAVHTFDSGDSTTGDHAEQTIVPDRQAVIDHAASRLVYWNRQIEMLGDGTHPAIDQPVDFFEIRAAMIRAHAQMQEGNP